MSLSFKVRLPHFCSKILRTDKRKWKENEVWGRSNIFAFISDQKRCTLDSTLTNEFTWKTIPSGLRSRFSVVSDCCHKGFGVYVAGGDSIQQFGKHFSLSSHSQREVGNLETAKSHFRCRRKPHILHTFSNGLFVLVGEKYANLHACKFPEGSRKPLC